MDIIHINSFNSHKDNHVNPMEVMWDDFVSLICSGHLPTDNKQNVKLFNTTQFKETTDIPSDTDDVGINYYTDELYTKRRKINAISNHTLIIDYDGGMLIDEAKEKFKNYEYVGYTSYNHLTDGKTHKFRIVIKLTKPIPSWIKTDDFNQPVEVGDWYEIKNSIVKFVGDSDPVVTNPIQIYYMPSCNEDYIDKSESWYNKGIPLDWEKFERNPFDKPKVISTTDGYSVSNIDTASETLHPNDILETENGNVRVGDVKTIINGVKCPFHNDKKGSELLRHVPESGNTFLFCKNKQCNKKYYMDRSTEFFTSNKKDNTLEDDLGLLNFPYDKDYFDTSNRIRVGKQLKRIGEKIQNDRGVGIGDRRIYKSHIVYMPEGSGKSHLVTEFAKTGGKIIFTCKSWSQAEEKYNQFKRFGKGSGFNVKIIRSKDAKARNRWGGKTLRGGNVDPYTSGKILDEDSINNFIDLNKDLNPDFIRLSWKYFESDRLTFESIPYQNFDEEGNVVYETLSENLNENTNIVITTFEQLRIHKLKKVNIPNDWIIWFDDPDITDVININPYNENEWDHLDDEDVDKKTLIINGKQYFIRDHNQSLGFSLKDHKTIYTTTESITLEAIENLLRLRKENFTIHDEMENISGGKVTILGTKKVWKMYDGIIPLINRRLHKLGYNNTLIADGLSSKYNHSNSKGLNDLSDKNILVELSIPHPVEVRTICDSLHLDFDENRIRITNSIMLDKMNQAIGRNSGYRYKVNEGNECVVLVDSKKHKYLKENTRYFIDMDNSVLIDRTDTMSRLEKRTKENASPLVKEIETLINNIDNYVSNKRTIKPDIEFVVKTIENDSERIKLLKRIIYSLISHSGLQTDTKESDSWIQEKYRDICIWIIEKWIPEDNLKHIYEELEGNTEEN